MNNIAIQLKNINKSFNTYAKPRYRLQEMLRPILGKFHSRFDRNYAEEFWALKNINLEVKKGEAFGIIGRNGAGKSTLLQIIAGTLTPTTGSLKVVGRVNALLELGSGFNPDFTGRENVYMNGSILGFSKKQIEEKFDEILQFSEIEKHIDLPVKTYSSGMFVRLAFSVQAFLEPDILIVDEALSVGDVFFQQKCHKRIESMLEGGKTTFLFVTHDMGSIEKYCNKALVLHKGEAIYCGDKKTAILKYYRPDVSISTLNGKKGKNHLKGTNSRYTVVGNNKDVELTEINIFNSRTKVINQSLELGQNFDIGFEMRINKEIIQPIIDITIKDYRGIPVFSTSSLMLRKFSKKNGNVGDIIISKFEFQNLLNIGKYVVSVGIGDWKKNNISPHDLETPRPDDIEFIASFENVADFEIVSSGMASPWYYGMFDLKPKFTMSLEKGK